MSLSLYLSFYASLSLTLHLPLSVSIYFSIALPHYLSLILSAQESSRSHVYVMCCVILADGRTLSVRTKEGGRGGSGRINGRGRREGGSGRRKGGRGRRRVRRRGRGGCIIFHSELSAPPVSVCPSHSPLGASSMVFVCVCVCVSLSLSFSLSLTLSSFPPSLTLFP